MGWFSKDENKTIPPCPIEDILGEAIFYLDGRGANLYVYDKCIVIDRTQGGLFNLGNRTYKVIPIKYIIAYWTSNQPTSKSRYGLYLSFLMQDFKQGICMISSHSKADSYLAFL